MIPIAKPYLTKEEADAAAETVLSGWVAQGPKVKEFEQRFAEYTGARHAVAVSNCTTALHLAMIVTGIGPGDEVICPSMSYIASSNCVRYAGAMPVFAEIRPVDFNLDPDDVRKRITGKTKAVIAVHQIGMPAAIDELKRICDEHGLKLIEDAACAAGSSYKGKKIGSHSGIACFSFHPRKVITTGEGGMITTSNEELSERIRLLRQHAMNAGSYDRHLSAGDLTEEHTELGYNYRMTDIQAAIGIRQLEKLDMIVKERRNIAEFYNSRFEKIEWLRVPCEKEGCMSNYQSYALTLLSGIPVSRDELMSLLGSEGVSTRKGIMTAHREKAYRDIMPGISLPVSEHASDNSILLPLYYPMKEEEMEEVAVAVEKIFERF